MPGLYRRKEFDMSKIPNYYAMTLPELLELRRMQGERNQKFLEKERKKYAKRSKNLGTAAKVTKSAGEATKPGGLFSRLIASLGKDKE